MPRPGSIGSMYTTAWLMYVHVCVYIWSEYICRYENECTILAFPL